MTKIPETTVDLRLPPEERWAKMLLKHESKVCEILEGVEEEVEQWGKLAGLGKKVAGLFRRLFGAEEYVREINAISDCIGADPNLLYAANLGYDISSWGGTYEDSFKWLPGFGCTGFIDDTILARNMDWDFPPGIEKHSMVIRFIDGRNEFITVGFPGHIGVISGLSSCGFGLAINQAYAARFIPRFTAMPVTWQVRGIFERAASFKAANRILCDEKTLTSAFYLLCGGKAGEALLVESNGETDVVTRAGKGEYLAVANHFLTPGLGDVVVDAELADSVERLNAIEKGVNSCESMTVSDAKRILSREPVLNGYTAHQMVMEPGKLTLRCPWLSQRWSTFKVG